MRNKELRISIKKVRTCIKRLRTDINTLLQTPLLSILLRLIKGARKRLKGDALCVMAFMSQRRLCNMIP